MSRQIVSFRHRALDSFQHVVMAEVHFHVIILPIFNQTKYHSYVQEHMASAFDNMEKDLLFFEQKVWFSLVEVGTHFLAT